MNDSLPRKGEEQGDLATSRLHQKIVLSSRRRRQAAVESRSTLHTPRKRVLNAVIWARQTAKGMSFNVTCGHRGDADQIAAQTRRADIMIEDHSLHAKRDRQGILLKDYQARLEHRNASSSNAIGDEKIRTMTVPGQTLERDKASGTRSSRQSKSETAAGKSTKSAAYNVGIFFHILWN